MHCGRFGGGTRKQRKHGSEKANTENKGNTEATETRTSGGSAAAAHWSEQRRQRRKLGSENVWDLPQTETTTNSNFIRAKENEKVKNKNTANEFPKRTAANCKNDKFVAMCEKVLF